MFIILILQAIVKLAHIDYRVPHIPVFNSEEVSYTFINNCSGLPIRVLNTMHENAKNVYLVLLMNRNATIEEEIQVLRLLNALDVIRNRCPVIIVG